MRERERENERDIRGRILSLSRKNVEKKRDLMSSKRILSLTCVFKFHRMLAADFAARSSGHCAITLNRPKKQSRIGEVGISGGCSSTVVEVLKPENALMQALKNTRYRPSNRVGRMQLDSARTELERLQTIVQQHSIEDMDLRVVVCKGQDLTDYAFPPGFKMEYNVAEKELLVVSLPNGPHEAALGVVKLQLGGFARLQPNLMLSNGKATYGGYGREPDAALQAFYPAPAHGGFVPEIATPAAGFCGAARCIVEVVCTSPSSVQKTRELVRDYFMTAEVRCVVVIRFTSTTACAVLYKRPPVVAWPGGLSHDNVPQLQAFGPIVVEVKDFGRRPLSDAAKFAWNNVTTGPAGGGWNLPAVPPAAWMALGARVAPPLNFSTHAGGPAPGGGLPQRFPLVGPGPLVVAGSVSLNIPTNVLWYRIFERAEGPAPLVTLALPLPGTPGGDGITIDLGEIMNFYAF
jgi:hypothetical protein